MGLFNNYRISANSCRNNYLFFFGGLSVTSIQRRQLFKGGNYYLLDFWKCTKLELLSQASVPSFA
jgi:hypothetical protein